MGSFAREAGRLTGQIAAGALLIFLVGANVFAAGDTQLDPETLVGTHPCRGRNPDGSTYQGTVQIRAKGPLVLIQWNIKGEVTYGTGLIEGMSLGVALENGVALYQIVPQAEGKSLIGMWATQGASAASEEAIFVGNTDVENAKFPLEQIDGAYQASGSTFGDGVDEVSIAGKDVLKKIFPSQNKRVAIAEGLTLGDSFAVITPTGLAVYQIGAGKPGQQSLVGHSVDKSGQIIETSLVPAE